MRGQTGAFFDDLRLFFVAVDLTEGTTGEGRRRGGEGKRIVVDVEATGRDEDEATGITGIVSRTTTDVQQKVSKAKGSRDK